MRIPLAIMMLLLGINVVWAEDCRTQLSKEDRYQDLSVILNCLSNKIKTLEAEVKRIEAENKATQAKSENAQADKTPGPKGKGVNRSSVGGDHIEVQRNTAGGNMPINIKSGQ